MPSNYYLSLRQRNGEQETTHLEVWTRITRIHHPNVLFGKPEQ